MRIIAASIDLAKIDKSRIIEGKNGAKYYNISILVKDEKDQYEQDVAITQGQTKEERTAKVKAVYIGNGKTVYDKPAEPKQQEPTGLEAMPEDDGLPF